MTLKRTYDFDQVINRKNTDSLKYDFVLERGKKEDILPMWIADMDFKIPDEIVDALHNRVDQGIFGYTETKDRYFEAVRYWMEKRHGWIVEKEWLVKCPGVVFALAMGVRAFTEAGDGVLIQQPVYQVFDKVIRENDRVVIDNTLILGEDGKYHMDLEDFERKAVQHQVKLFLLCNPHNPGGIVWSQGELEKLGEICIRRDIIIISDEIHQDFVFKGKHQVFANINEALKERTITCTAPSKTFNLAGLQVANIFIPNSSLRETFCKQMRAVGYDHLNTLGLVACEAGYRYGEAWLEQLLDYLEGNISYVREYLEKKISRIKLIEPDATYLLWLDFRELGLSEEERLDLLDNKVGIWLNSGLKFGKSGEGFERMNIACQRSVLKEALRRLERAVNAR
ncbi:MalY/PatB family protein [Lacrimispora defluvii]|uniref:cysteine-S-conjugate beta-lyase n=1 Tax=Lacrimispora defluvii TaxID=2719233 RepID=A0ABX1VNR5_9FIRM|nr:MalY/PatB family protein [Lacrimispora defluvii]NNJ29838.1 pyridoxal phosphate-dependent aminotransferase [Lacrimispora defluvii]